MNKLIQLRDILNSYQRKQFIFLFFLMLVSMFLEISVLKFMLIILNYFSNPESNVNSFIFMYINNLNINLEFSLLIVCIFVLVYLSKTLINIFI